MSEAMISCLTWVPKGACKVIPDDHDQESDKDMENLISQQENMSLNQLKANQSAATNDYDTDSDASDTELKENEDILTALDMDNYDDGMEEDDLVNRILGTTAVNDDILGEISDDEEDIEENMIRPTDSCIVVGSASEIDSSIEVYIYNENTSNLYVHHEILVAGFPLSLKWFNTHPKPTPDVDGVIQTKGSFIAVGTFLPGIEIWDLDILNPLEPIRILGGYETKQDVGLLQALDDMSSSKLKKGKKKAIPKPKLLANSHSDAVMCMDWHHKVPNRLASGSADKTIKLWDITTGECVQTLNRHKDKVQSIAWNPVEYNILASGSFDRTLAVGDVRHEEQTKFYALPSDVEAISWDPLRPFLFFATTETGEIFCFDIRNSSNSHLWSFKAHKKPATAVSFNTVVEGLFATVSPDKTIKLWDSSDLSNPPVCIASRDLNVGELFTMSFDISSPFIIAAGGKEGCLVIWDTLENVEMNKRYGKQAEALGLGPQELPAEHIELQLQGQQAPGLGPGVTDDSYKIPDDSEEDEEYDESKYTYENVEMDED